MASGEIFQIITSPEAETDIQTIVKDLIDKYSIASVTSWVNELDRIQKRLAINPYQYQSYFLFVHRVNFRRFPYFIAYAVDSIDQEVEILMVAHQQQDPDRLLRRLNL
ncbi:MAG: type II toxin-antitoxin system RelE/ParE family toxin [Cytophagaceae bacterium]|nr:MAG: type II toxin-antitoxin system RelE/ParE family toxin [Cytophagaceae bacterium]